MEKKYSHLSILIVEDSQEMVTLLKMCLKVLGFKIDVAFDGAQAYQMVKENTPDLIISDIMMPGTDGVAFRNNLLKNEQYRFIPFIFLTAKDSLDERVAGLKMFVDDYISKPFEIPELVARVESIIQRHDHYKNIINYDGLTRLYNRKTFMEKLTGEVHRVQRYTGKVSFAILDLDNFKQTNDTYGHTFGDFVLVKVADLFHSKLRETDFAGRYGGEEFLLAMPETDKETSKIVVERLRKAVSELKFDQQNYSVTLSAGVVTVPDDGVDISKLMELADAMLYKAKNAGRNRIEVANWQELKPQYE